MKKYEQKEIDLLIGCEKEIVEPPKKEMKSERGSKRNSMKLQSKKGDAVFRVFMRQSTAFDEDFSIGLEYLPIDERENLMLIRCNGNHSTEKEGHPPHHYVFHIHKAKEDNILKGKRPEAGGEQTKEYASYEQALSYFLRLINVNNPEEYFKDINQIEIDFTQGEQS